MVNIEHVRDEGEVKGPSDDVPLLPVSDLAAHTRRS
jgi:hypothetical protein